MARRKRGRDIDGVVLLDKPVGCSSNAALQRVRRAFDARKAGHTGSLDPLASGLLPVCLGEATKVSSFLLLAEKQYRVTAMLGSETATGDREGEVTRRSDTSLPDGATIEATLARFTGAQQQIPPMYSALKKDGKRLYEIARAGQTVEREPRDIVVHTLALVAADTDSFSLDVAVSSGTYVRTLVEDIAGDWGCCAHVGTLHRVRVGGLGSELVMTPLAEIERRAAAGDDLADLLLPVSSVLGHWPEARLEDDDVDALLHGRSVSGEGVPDAGDGLLRLVARDGRFLGLGVRDARGMLAPRRLFTRPQR